MEEIDEANFWLDFIKSLELSKQIEKLDQLIDESDNILKILAKARTTAKNPNNQIKEPTITYYLAKLFDEEE